MNTNQSKSAQALILLVQGVSAKDAAEQLGISRSAIYKERAKLAGQRLCPCCGHAVKPAAK